MAEIRTNFPTLEDPTSKAGEPLHKVLEGDGASGKNASASLVAKDPSGNLIYLNTDASGNVYVIPDSTAAACLDDEGEVTGTTAYQTIATIVLQNNKEYKNLGFLGSSFRDAIYEIVAIADVGGTPVETRQLKFRTDTAHPTHSDELECISFTSGGTGVQHLILRAKNLNALSEISGLISIREIQ